MDSVKEKLDEIEKRIMDGLKDFQRETVKRIAHLYRNKINRVLVSDEVGLGKTLIARGTIAKFAQLRKEEGDDLVKVVYVCSNSAIAEQNLNRLKITDELTTDGISDSRLSMQHLCCVARERVCGTVLELLAKRETEVDRGGKGGSIKSIRSPRGVKRNTQETL